MPVTIELPDDVVASLIAIGEVEWGVSETQSDEKHVSDFIDTLRLTREYFTEMPEETALHYVACAGTSVLVASTGNSPNSAQHAKILTGAWNYLLDAAMASRGAEQPRQAVGGE